MQGLAPPEGRLDINMGRLKLRGRRWTSRAKSEAPGWATDKRGHYRDQHRPEESDPDLLTEEGHDNSSQIVVGLLYNHNTLVRKTRAYYDLSCISQHGPTFKTSILQLNSVCVSMIDLWYKIWWISVTHLSLQENWPLWSGTFSTKLLN